MMLPPFPPPVGIQPRAFVIGLLIGLGLVVGIVFGVDAWVAPVLPWNPEF